MVHRKEIEFNGQPYILETGRLAKQASGAVLLQYGETMVLATVCTSESAVEGQDFFPLQVEYRERAYAAGKIPGGFIKREGRPADQEILNARLIDRPIRPLFPEGFFNEVQVMVHVISADRQNDADVLGITAASVALNLSDIPFEGPIAGVRVGRVGGEFFANPTFDQRAKSDIDLVIAASDDSIIMVEGEAQEISEEDMLAALEFGHGAIRSLIALQKDFLQGHTQEKMAIAQGEDYSELISKVRDLCGTELAEALKIVDKKERHKSLGNLTDSILEKLAEEYPDMEKVIKGAVHDYEKEIMRDRVLNEGVRLDGRGLDDIRPISIEIGLLPRTHGSALFTRGQTQALAVTTLGTKIDEQMIEGVGGEYYKNYMLHYNFPPFSTGEVKPMRGTSRREVGHGNLAERSIKPSIPADGLFPYTIRIVSDVLESNGSSSMATVCAGSLSLMDAGVPVKSHIAGIAMGLIKGDDKVAVLTDILGDEDHMGDMDFKVAGNRTGITGFQMDIKIKGISTDIMREALERAKKARLFILEKMEAAIQAPRDKLSIHAPRILNFKVEVDEIGLVIGPGGKTIRDVQEKTGATINIEDSGMVTIAHIDAAGGEAALDMIKNIVAKPLVGTVYKGKVKSIKNFGAFVEILPGKEGLLHISRIAKERINRVEDVLRVGDEVHVKLLEIDSNGKLVLSRKDVL
ncbi:polyribonucleotide nucleotidyltransferase [candidate division KSB1 bacterium]|nr:polyribonucleotide nucleotidyltransferase [candidate division KSB1 bacterium]RQW05494.1 MAG: polyribonucleotide nucleotidyltransferase [candidate division KSB1 bacterium]